ncbi:MAG: MotA/TolQ/ExbB proton channel family protein [Candidatus Erginobacter occultus]|nr:MotA/TolQ/ExbB proton channel family protein [Candidatus Erginobacter occultus]
MIQLLFRGGYTMIPILLCSVVSLAVIIERAFSLRAARVLPPPLLKELEESGRPLDELASRLQGERGILAGVLAAGLENRGISPEQNREILQAAEKAAASRMERGLTLLEIVAVISPLLGLLGTVIGMVQVFEVISQVGAGHAQALSRGISQALISTIAGLVVAIPALIAHSVYSRKVDSLLLRIEQATARLLLRLSR